MKRATPFSAGQAREVGRARGLEVQQIDTGAFADDERQHAWLERCGFERVGVMRAMGRDAEGRWRDVVLMQRRSPRVGVERLLDQAEARRHRRGLGP